MPQGFSCNEEPKAGSIFCIFHDEDYLKGHYVEFERQATKRFEEKVNKSISENKPLQCNAYFLPDIKFAKYLQNNLTTQEKTFPQLVYFNKATFCRGADFSLITFFHQADFNGATFSGEAYFTNAIFSAKANFYGATFSGEAFFHSAKFSKEANFNGATFSGEASFHWAKFSGEAYFGGARFSKEATFFILNSLN